MDVHGSGSWIEIGLMIIGAIFSGFGAFFLHDFRQTQKDIAAMRENMANGFGDIRALVEVQKSHERRIERLEDKLVCDP